MKRLFLCLFLFFVCFCILHAADNEWKSISGTHFFVYYKNAPEAFIRQILDKAEDYYDDIAEKLGFTRFNFWLWDNRAKIYIHDDLKAFQEATGQPTWSGGCARVDTKTIHTYPYAQGFTETILPHEMGHIIFREFVGFDNRSIPLWIDEGVAAYQEPSRYIVANQITKNAFREGRLIDLARLSRIDQDTLKNSNFVNLFYSEALSLVDFLIKEYGRDEFVYFCQNLRDKKDFMTALSSTYPFSDLREFDEAWQKYLKK